MMPRQSGRALARQVCVATVALDNQSMPDPCQPFWGRSEGELPFDEIQFSAQIRSEGDIHTGDPSRTVRFKPAGRSNAGRTRRAGCHDG